MKYKILTNGKDYIIQNKTIFFWHTLRKVIEPFTISECTLTTIIRFTTEKLAEKYAKEYWGKTRKRIRKYK